MKKIFTLLVCLLFVNIIKTNAQVAINNDGTSADANAMLDIKSTAKGVKFPRMTSAQRSAIATTADDAGLMVFDTDKGALFMFDGAQWVPFAYAAFDPLGQMKAKSAAGASSDSYLGYSCDMSGDFAVAGALKDSVGPNAEQGSAYVFKKVNGSWIQQARLVADDGMKGDQFGCSVAIDGSYIVVGAQLSNSYKGAMYVFVRNGDNWTQQAKIIVADAKAYSYFGACVAIEGSTIVTGARLQNVGANSDQGCAYVYTRSGSSWSLKTQLVANDGQTGDIFGSSVSIYGSYIAVGAPDALVNGVKSGAAYIFLSTRGGGYAQQAKLLSNNATNGGYFGSSISLDSNRVVVGAWRELHQGLTTGSAHLFTRTNGTWTHKTIFYPNTTASDLEFGMNVMIKGNTLLITSSNENMGGNTGQGGVYLFQYDTQYLTYRLVNRITNNSTQVNEHFGESAAFDGPNYIIGAPFTSRYPQWGDGLVFFGMFQ